MVFSGVREQRQFELANMNCTGQNSPIETAGWVVEHASREHKAPRRLTVLGSTGSVGQATMDVIAHSGGAFEVDALVANSNIARLVAQARAARARLAVTADPDLYEPLREALHGSGIAAAAGPRAVIEAAGRPVDMVVAAIVGAQGLEPTLAALNHGTAVALANKECLVCAGHLVTAAAKRKNARLLPVDSEHSAIFQVLETDNADAVERIILTASGGPFREIPRHQLAAVTPEQALRHPNWRMGRKVTIDSATLMNKGLELIEAAHLFSVDADKIDVLVHPQSVIHSLVEYHDGSLLAQLGLPDMRMPVAYALGWPQRIKAPVGRLRLETIAGLTFETVDAERFPAVALCRSALMRGAAATSILNAANEVAVAAFLSRRISFPTMTALVDKTLECAETDNMLGTAVTLEEIQACDAYGRKVAGSLVVKLSG